MHPRPCAEARMPCEPRARVGMTAMPVPESDRASERVVSGPMIDFYLIN